MGVSNSQEHRKPDTSTGLAALGKRCSDMKYMMIAIDFGLDLEGGSLATESWGEITCGPDALLELLELRLSLTHLPASQTSRAVVYRGLLEHLANQQPRSLAGR